MRALGLGLSLGFFDAIVGADMLLAASITLTDAQIKTLPTAAIELVADPGVNSYLVPVMATFEFSRVGGAVYTNVTQADLAQGASNIVISWGAFNVNAFQPMSMECISGVHGSKRTAICMPWNFQNDPIAVTDFLFAPGFGNLPVNGGKNFTISAYNVAGNFTGGGAANTLTATAYYLVRTFGSLTN